MAAAAGAGASAGAARRHHRVAERAGAVPPEREGEQRISSRPSAVRTYSSCLSLPPLVERLLAGRMHILNVQHLRTVAVPRTARERGDVAGSPASLGREESVGLGRAGPLVLLLSGLRDLAASTGRTGGSRRPTPGRGRRPHPLRFGGGIVGHVEQRYRTECPRHVRLHRSSMLRRRGVRRCDGTDFPTFCWAFRGGKQCSSGPAPSREGALDEPIRAG